MTVGHRRWHFRLWLLLGPLMLLGLTLAWAHLPAPLTTHQVNKP
jgi:hypothetical protein